MPKRANNSLVWCEKHARYEQRAPQQSEQHAPLEPADLARWLGQVGSFAFAGRHGYFTALREARARGAGYWYAYRSQGQRTIKRYLGPAAGLTVERLEGAARALALQAAAHDEAAAPAASQPALLITKLQAPRLPADLVHRGRLLARLSQPQRLTLICAPDGFGKTTLAASALRAAGESVAAERSAAWLTLDVDDNDPLRFWRYLIAACQQLQPKLGQRALQLLQAARRPPFPAPELRPALTALLNDLAGLQQPAVLVLDNYDQIETPEIHDSLAFVLAQLPGPLQLIMITRSEPPLPLAQLRARGELAELGAADLRFSQDEIAAFMAQALPCPLPAALLADLEARTAGWAAGLRLAAIALQGQSDHELIAGRIAGLSGSQRPFAEYLSRLLETQPAPVQSFLLRASILDRLTGGLCDAIGGGKHSRAVLAEIQRTGLFLTPLEEQPGWYRFHPLVGEALRSLALERLRPAQLRRLYRRASAWYALHGLPAEAIDSALAGQDWPRAAALTEQIVEAGNLFDPDQPHRLRRWLEQLPEPTLARHPALCLSLAIVTLRTSSGPVAARVGSLDRPLQLAEQGWRREGNMARLGAATTMRVLAAMWSGKIDTAIGLARKALAWLPAGDSTWRGICLGFVGLDEARAGQLDIARQTILEARAHTGSSRVDQATRAHTLMLADICAGQCELHQAGALYRQVLAQAGDDRTDRARALLGLAQLSYEANDLEAAASDANAALALSAEQPMPIVRLWASALLSQIDLANRQPDGALKRVAELLAALQPLHMPALYRATLAQQARLQLASGDLAAARRWVAGRARYAADLREAQEEQEALLVARIAIAEGQAGAALQLLGQALAPAQAAGRHQSALTILALTAIAQAACQQSTQARDTLAEALALGQAAGYRRLFLDEGPQLAALLQRTLPTLAGPGLHSYARSLLSEARGQAAPEPHAPLSRQEQRVLELLVSGCSNSEIARALVVSPNTIKTQLKQIYRKLGASSRHEASSAARRLGLL